MPEQIPTTPVIEDPDLLIGGQRSDNDAFPVAGEEAASPSYRAHRHAQAGAKQETTVPDFDETYADINDYVRQVAAAKRAERRAAALAAKAGRYVLKDTGGRHRLENVRPSPAGSLKTDATTPPSRGRESWRRRLSPQRLRQYGRKILLATVTAGLLLTHASTSAKNDSQADGLPEYDAKTAGYSLLAEQSSYASAVPELPYPHFNRAAVPSKYVPILDAAAQRYGLDPAVLAAQDEAESSFSEAVVHGRRVSREGAKGIAQFMDGTFRQYGVDGDGDGRADVLNPADAIMSQANFMRHLTNITTLDKIPGDSQAHALAAYNAGYGRVKTYGGVPPRSFARGETANYVKKILRLAREKYTVPQQQP